MLALLGRLGRRKPKAPPITSMVGLTLALRMVIAAAGVATATGAGGRRGKGVGVMDLDEYAVEWLVGKRLREARAGAVTRAANLAGRSGTS